MTKQEKLFYPKPIPPIKPVKPLKTISQTKIVAVFYESSFPLVVSSKDLNILQFDEIRVYDDKMKYRKPTIELVKFNDISNPHYISQMATYQKHMIKYKKEFVKYQEELLKWEKVIEQDIDNWTVAIELDLEDTHG